MWYPSQQQQQLYSWHGYAHHFPSRSQQQQTYLKSSYYIHGDELSTTNVIPIHDENESPPIHCQTTYGGNAHVITDCYVTTSNNSYGDEMPSFHPTPTRNAYWNPVIAAPPTKNMTIMTSPSPIISSSSSATTCWDWLLFSPEYYSEFYTPLTTCVQKIEEDKDNDIDCNFQASLPTCLLELLYITPKLINTSDDENDSDQEISSLHRNDESLLLKNTISSNLSLSSDNNNNSNLNINNQNSKENRSSTPDTDDGYQSASDVSRSDYSQQSSIHDDHKNSKDDITITKHSLPTPLMPRRITYAAAVKPIITIANKISSPPILTNKSKQISNNILSTTTGINTNDMLNTKGQKSKFIAPRFERMHHAKQHTSSSISSNRTQIRSNNNNINNNNQRNHIVNSTRRR
ncbi:unnamed protein product [Rotaria sp. Silwood1]|nr:unnamed protein product [Rotaria sp. Silwood1]CAF1414728.1 unnamed protein product [Rotaria sp. Silwood1]CAF3579632.1 unnamed protein product [Rotaria sp. Silwood1]CAF3648278.1 unnamed protein product [Rotaria sp. Silwood1]CAF4640939.1 unnamed protein product [Rotaria sp. Silwood1]